MLELGVLFVLNGWDLNAFAQVKLAKVRHLHHLTAGQIEPPEEGTTMKRYGILGLLALSLVCIDVIRGAADDQFGKKRNKAVQKWEKDVRKKEERDRKTTRKFAEKQRQADRNSWTADRYYDAPFYDPNYTYRQFDDYRDDGNRLYRPPRPFRQPSYDDGAYYEELPRGYIAPRIERRYYLPAYDPYYDAPVYGGRGQRIGTDLGSQIGELIGGSE